MADTLRQRQAFLDLFSEEHRHRIQLLAAMIHMFMRDPNGKPVQLTNEEALSIAHTELTAMMFTDLAMQEKEDAESEREQRIGNLMKRVCATKQ